MSEEPAGGAGPLEVRGLEAFAPYLINRISARYNADLAAVLREQGLTTAQMRALAVLAVHPGLTINALAIYAVMEQSTMSRTVDAMAEAGLVERRGRDGDARVREVVLTDAGRAAFDGVWPLMNAAEQRMLEGLSEAERPAFVAALRTVLHAIRKHDF
ncbi:MAG: MarR family transcriptional regulator [Pseudomonadota bacterium]